MSKKVKHGKVFEESIENSCKKQNIFFHRIRDVHIPFELREKIRLPKNKYDNLIFHKQHLFAIELKSTKNKSIGFNESTIKQHQIDNLLEASTYENVIAGFIFNYREPNNKAFFVEINDFVAYKHIAENEIENHTYKNKVNKSSIPLAICEEIGIEIKNKLLRTKYNYDIDSFVNEVIEKINKL